MPENLLRALALDGGGMNAYSISEYKDATLFHYNALSLADEYLKEEHDKWLYDAILIKARALDGLGRVARENGVYDISYNLHLQAINLFNNYDLSKFHVHVRPGPVVLIANAISNAGVAAYRSGDKNIAKRCHNNAKQLRENLGDLRGYSSSLGNLAEMETLDNALPLYMECISIRKALHDIWGIAGSHRAIAAIYQKNDNMKKSIQYLRLAIPTFVNIGDMLGIAECLEILGLNFTQQDSRKAAKFIAAAMSIRQHNDMANIVHKPEITIEPPDIISPNDAIELATKFAKKGMNF